MINPYASLPSYTRWSRAVATPAFGDVDPVIRFPFQLNAEDKVATAGSCFAQHIARHLRNSGFCYYVVEPEHPLGDAETNKLFNYGTFSARYGNLYTTTQLLQLLKRSLGLFTPEEDIWTLPGGGLADPFRPAIQPNGFSSLAELKADREEHLAAVRRMFETLDTFVFTLGLTEAWRCKADGAVLPVCPGVHGGTFSDEKYEFVNFSVFDVLADMREFLTLLKTLNAKARVILTVSPVPLIATAADRHVLVSTTYSKSALRVACEELVKENDFIAYFPSYEIITGAFTRGRYFAEDLRSVTEEGVDHVMRLFLKYATVSGSGKVAEPAPATKEADLFVARMGKVVSTICDEELLEASVW